MSLHPESDEMLTLIWKRFDLAERRCNELSVAIEKWAGDPPGFTLASRLSEDGLSWTGLLSWEQPPVDEWGLLASEYLHHLRGCLDNLVWALGHLDGPPARREALHFPILCSSGENGKAWTKAKRALSSLPAAAVQAIERTQPFVNTPRFPEGDPLAVLHRLDIADKHRITMRPLLDPKDLDLSFTIQYTSGCADSASKTRLGHRMTKRGATLRLEAVCPMKSVELKPSLRVSLLLVVFGKYAVPIPEYLNLLLPVTRMGVSKVLQALHMD